jgi:hypothetical protein
MSRTYQRPNWLCLPKKVTNLSTGQVWNKPPSGSWNSVAFAAKMAQPGDVIGFKGIHPAITIGVGNQWSANTVKWPNGPVHGLTIVGMGPDAKLVGGIALGSTYGVPSDLTFSNFTLYTDQAQAGVITHMNSGPYLGLQFVNLTIDTRGTDPKTGKLVNKWGFRFHGPAQFHINNCIQPYANIEHFVYADNVAKSSHVLDCSATKNGRTMVQIVNRNISGPSSSGDIIINGCVAIHSGYIEGGSAFTCSGHLGGTVIVVNCSTVNARGGSLVAWAEGSLTDTKHAYRNANGYAIDTLHINNCNFHAVSSDRDSIALSSCEFASMGQSQIISNKSGLRLDALPGQANGQFEFTAPNPSQWGWQVYRKVVKGHSSSTTQVLTDQQIDALYQEA